MFCPTVLRLDEATRKRAILALLARGAHILDQLFPGLLSELVDQGAPVWDDGGWSKLYMSIAGHVLLREGLGAFDHEQMALYLNSTTAGYNMIDVVRATRNFVPQASVSWAALGVHEGGRALGRKRIGR
jgi:hypothetical protein